MYGTNVAVSPPTCMRQTKMLQYKNVEIFSEFAIHKKCELITTVNTASFSKNKQRSTQ